MNIAIIGTGNVGRALATSIRRAGHDVVLAARDVEKTRSTASDLGVRSADTPRDAASGADVVILAVPGDALPAVARDLEDAVAGKAVVDVSNRFQPDLTAASNAETLQAALPGAPVIKAFNTAFASRQADPSVDGIAADGFVAGDDEDAKRRVLELVESVGFHGVDAGPLTAARTLEGLAWINIARNLDGGTWQGALILLEPGRSSN